MLKSLVILLAAGVAFGGVASAQTLHKSLLADDHVAPLLVDHKEKHKNKEWKHSGQRRDDDEDEDEGRRRRSTARSWPGYGAPNGGYYGSSRPYYDTPRYAPPRYYDYGPAPYYRGY